MKQIHSDILPILWKGESDDEGEKTSRYIIMCVQCQERNSLRNKEYQDGSSIYGTFILNVTNVLLDMLAIFSFSL